MQKKDPPILVTRPSLPPVEEYETLVREIFTSQYLTNGGAQHKKLESALKEKLNTPFLSLFTNGHLALECAISALNLEPGEIITTPFTFISSTHAIVRCGFTPVFVDVEPVFFTLDPNKIEEKITPRTRAILPVHVYGNPCDMDAIDAIGKKYNLPVLYDAAHAFGISIGNRAVADYGTASMFSFHATKCYNTIEGGAIATKDQAFAERLNGYKNFGFHADESVLEVGGNAKMNEFQAAMGLLNLKYFDGEIEKRSKVAARYREHLSKIDGLSLRPVRAGATQNYAYLPVSFDPAVFGANRDQVSEALKQHNIFARKYFYPLTSEAACYAGRFDPGETPIAYAACRNVLTLPMYASLPISDVDDICQIIASCRA